MGMSLCYSALDVLTEIRKQRNWCEFREIIVTMFKNTSTSCFTRRTLKFLLIQRFLIRARGILSNIKLKTGILRESERAREENSFEQL